VAEGCDLCTVDCVLWAGASDLWAGACDDLWTVDCDLCAEDWGACDLWVVVCLEASVEDELLVFEAGALFTASDVLLRTSLF